MPKTKALTKALSKKNHMVILNRNFEITIFQICKKYCALPAAKSRKLKWSDVDEAQRIVRETNRLLYKIWLGI